MSLQSKNTYNSLNHNQRNDKQRLFENLITSEQLSKRLQVPIKTIRDWVYRRKVPYKKLGRLVRFDPGEIRKWINERTENVY